MIRPVQPKYVSWAELPVRSGHYYPAVEVRIGKVMLLSMVPRLMAPHQSGIVGFEFWEPHPDSNARFAAARLAIEEAAANRGYVLVGDVLESSTWRMYWRDQDEIAQMVLRAEIDARTAADGGGEQDTTALFRRAQMGH